jgi:hypothetical protein
MRVRPVAELIQCLERGRHLRRMAGPVGHGHCPEDHVPALAGVAELARQPARRHDGIGVGGRQPDRGRITGCRQPQQFGHASRPGRTDAAGLAVQHPGPARLGDRGRSVGAGVGHHQQVERHRKRAAGFRQGRQAGSEQFFLVVRGNDDADGLDHTSPVAWATDTGGVPSVRR